MWGKKVSIAQQQVQQSGAGASDECGGAGKGETVKHLVCCANELGLCPVGLENNCLRV